MNTEFDLDSLKSAWQASTVEKSYSVDEIFSMLKRKSITAVKWVFIISFVEIIIAAGLYIYIFATVNLNEYHQSLLKEYGNLTFVYELLNFLIYGISFWFIWRFFKSYQKIQVQSSVRELSVDIINFRKYVQYFIRFNMTAFFIIMIISLISMWRTNPDLQQISLTSETGIMILAVSVVVMFFLFGIIWLYYYLLYGTFQRRLLRNLHDLDSIE